MSFSEHENSLDVLLRTNIPPTHDEALYLKRLLSAEETTVQRLERLETELKHVQTLLNAARRRADSYRRVLTPARRVPPEIIAHIFLHCCRLYNNAARLPPNPKEAPIVLTHICSAWRKVAHLTPQLWFKVDCAVAKQPQLDALQDLANTWSNFSPSSLTLYIFDLPPGPTADEFWSVVKRCKRLACSVKNISDFYMFFAPVSGSLSSLENLDLSLSNYLDGELQVDMGAINSEVWQLGSCAFENTPRLHSVALNNLGHIHSFNSIRLPWFQLTRIELYETYLDLSDIVTIMQHCASLEYACWHNWYESPGHLSALSPPVTLLHLHTLYLNFTGLIETGPFFDSFTLPALTFLVVDGIEASFKWPAASFSSFLDRSLPRLKHLGLNHDFEDPADLLAILSRLPTVTDFCMQWSLKSTFRALTRALDCHDNPPEPLLPLLESITLWGDLPSPQSLARTIASRWWSDSNSASAHPVARLRRIFINHHGASYISKLSSALAPCIAQGLQVL